MYDYGVISVYAPSLRVVAEDIASAIRKHGYTAQTYKYMVFWRDAKNQFRKAIIVLPFDPMFLPGWCSMCRDFLKVGIPNIIYVTIEGVVKNHLLHEWIKRDFTYIANSKFTEKMLLKSGVKPVKTVYHGVNLDEIRSVHPYKELLKEKVKGEMVFGTVASNLPRKGLNMLAKAINIAHDKIGRAKLYVLTTPDGKGVFYNTPKAYVSPHFGKLLRDEVLSLIGSFDFYICSSHAEGFGLPLLEANALGVPCIAPSYMPLTEVASPESTLYVNVTRVKYVDLQQGILYMHHEYSVEELAERIVEAYNIYMYDRERYAEMSVKGVEHSSKFNIYNLYRELIF